MNTHATDHVRPATAHPGELAERVARLEDFRAMTIELANTGETIESEQDFRILALEHAIVSGRARRRLRRRLRVSARTFAAAGGSFESRRLEATANEWLCNWDGWKRVVPLPWQ